VILNQGANTLGFAMFLRSSVLLGLSSLGFVLVGWLTGTSVLAAERVVLKYKIIQQSVSVAELSTFAETGQMSPDLETYMKLSNQDPKKVRHALADEVTVNAIVLDRGLNNPVGNILLDQVGLVIRTPSGEANRQALRSAIVLSASQDNKLSLIETIENYPTRDVYVEGDRLVEVYQQLSKLERGLGNFLGDIKLF
jgi:hypothetical protein